MNSTCFTFHWHCSCPPFGGGKCGIDCASLHTSSKFYLVHLVLTRSGDRQCHRFTFTVTAVDWQTSARARNNFKRPFKLMGSQVDTKIVLGISMAVCTCNEPIEHSLPLPFIITKFVQSLAMNHSYHWLYAAVLPFSDDLSFLFKCLVIIFAITIFSGSLS